MLHERTGFLKVRKGANLICTYFSRFGRCADLPALVSVKVVTEDIQVE